MTDKEKARLEFAKNSIYSPPYNKIDPSSLIHSSAVIGIDGFGWARNTDGTLVKVNHAGNVIIEKGVEIRAFVTVDRAVKGSTIIGEGVKIDHKVHVAHNCNIGKYSTIAANTSIEGSCVVGEYCTIGSNVTVQRKVKVGNNVLIGSGCVVTKDVPDNAVIVGNPHRILRFKEDQL
jgi:UDP-3-O-[3-hydroxymyristoyl] glucosamine N-acyltransferase